MTDAHLLDDAYKFLLVTKAVGIRNIMAEFAASCLAEKDEEIERLKKLFHDLTAGGSEFYNDPERCAEYIRHARHSTLEAAKMQARQKNEWKARAETAERELKELKAKPKE